MIFTFIRSYSIRCRCAQTPVTSIVSSSLRAESSERLSRRFLCFTLQHISCCTAPLTDPMKYQIMAGDDTRYMPCRLFIQCLCFRHRYIEDTAAAVTYEVHMLFRIRIEVIRTGYEAQLLNRTVLRKKLQITVDGRQADVWIPVTKLCKNHIRRRMILMPAKLIEDFLALS